jgi:hypothetical protein
MCFYENDKQLKQTQLLATNLISREREIRTQKSIHLIQSNYHIITYKLQTKKRTTLTATNSLFFQPCHLPGDNRTDLVGDSVNAYT